MLSTCFHDVLWFSKPGYDRIVPGLLDLVYFMFLLESGSCGRGIDRSDDFSIHVKCKCKDTTENRANRLRHKKRRTSTASAVDRAVAQLRSVLE